MFAVVVDAPCINWVDLFARARGAVQMKHATLSHLMGISEQQLSMQLAGTGHVSLFRLAAVASDPDGKAFLRELFDLLADELGFGEGDPVGRAVSQALAALCAVIGQLERAHMAKASLPQRERRRA